MKIIIEQVEMDMQSLATGKTKNTYYGYYESFDEAHKAINDEDAGFTEVAENEYQTINMEGATTLMILDVETEEFIESVNLQKELNKDHFSEEKMLSKGDF